MNITNESFSIISSSNADSTLLPVDGVDSSRSSAPTSESGSACFLDESDVAHNTPWPGASSITGCSPDYTGNSYSSCSQLKKRISKKNGRFDIWK